MRTRVRHELTYVPLAQYLGQFVQSLNIVALTPKIARIAGEPPLATEDTILYALAHSWA
jgi:hypothetical protein